MTNVSQNDLKERDFPADLLADPKGPTTWVGGIIQRWYALTSLPDAPIDSTIRQREAVRKSRLSSSVLFFLLILTLSLLPVTFLAINIYPWYFWLTLELFCVCIVSLILLRYGHTNAAGIVVTTAAFLTITTSLFSTIPFDETTLQGFDMYNLLLLLCVCVLPIRSVIFFYVLCVGVIIVALFKMPLTPALHADFQSRMFLILARPIGTAFGCTGVAYISAATLINAARRASRAEAIARLEHTQVLLSHGLSEEINQIVNTQVQVSNGNLAARVTLSNGNMLMQVARSLNVLLVRYQRAAFAEQQLQSVDSSVTNLVAQIQQAKIEGRNANLQWTNNPHLDSLIAELQGQTVSSIARPTRPNLPNTPEWANTQQDRKFPRRWGRT